MDDPRAKKIAKVVGNKTAHKILNFLSENPNKSEQDISSSLKVPLNTVGYNVKQLLESGLIEKTSNFFWSKKGKKISLYQVSNKSVVFSPKKVNLSSQIKSILPVSLLAGVGALVIRLVHPSLSFAKDEISQSLNAVPSLTSSAKEMVSNAELAGSGLVSSQPSIISLGSPIWWFLGGVLISIIIFILVNSVLKFEKNYPSKIEHKREVKHGI